jgi:outer membrane protein
MRILSYLAFLLLYLPLSAQQIWSLEDCIQHALEHNISLKQSALNVELNKIQYTQSISDVLPSLNGSSSISTNKGRSIDVWTNDVIEESNTSYNFSYSSNLTLFNGFKNIRQIQKSANETNKALYDLETAKTDLISAIALAYLQIIFNEELLETAQAQLILSQNQHERINTLVEAGALARGELLNIQSQLALEEQQKVQAENQLQLSKLQLAQLLDLDNYEDLQALKLDVGIPEIQLKESREDDYMIALTKQSSIKSSELAIKNAKYDLQIARASYYPSLSVSYSKSTLYSDRISDMMSFNDQIENNKQSGIYLSLSIPIFNRFAVRSAVNQSKLQVENSLLQAELSRNQLRKSMEQAYADQLAAYQRYKAAEKSVVAGKESFDYIRERYELGMVNSYEFNEAKNKVIKAESDELQAKYDYLFKIKLYDFYTSLKFEL